MDTNNFKTQTNIETKSICYSITSVTHFVCKLDCYINSTINKHVLSFAFSSHTKITKEKW